MGFEIGDIAVSVSDKNGNHPETIGLEVKVSAFAPATSGWDYIVVDSTGKIWFAYESELRKKKPPEASWGEIQKSIGWNPAKIEVEV